MVVEAVQPVAPRVHEEIILEAKVLLAVCTTPTGGLFIRGMIDDKIAALGLLTEAIEHVHVYHRKKARNRIMVPSHLNGP